MADAQTISFFVPGKPASAGSKRGFWNPKAQRKDGQCGKVIMVPDDERSMPWRTNVQGHALQAMAEQQSLAVLVAHHGKIEQGPIHLEITFALTRPKSHYRTGQHEGELRESAPVFVTTKPDLTKIVRAIEDALTGICWTDDNQVVRHTTLKRYVASREVPGAHIIITQIAT